MYLEAQWQSSASALTFKQYMYNDMRGLGLKYGLTKSSFLPFFCHKLFYLFCLRRHF